MILINTVSDKYFTLDGIQLARIYQPLAQGSAAIGIYSIYDTRQQLVNSTGFSEFLIDGTFYATQEETIEAILTVIWASLSEVDIEQLEGRVDVLEGDVSDLETQVQNLEENQVTGVVVYSTLADLPGSGTLLVSYKVSNDPTSSNNGYYHWTGAVYVKDASLAIGAVEDGNVDAVSGGTVYLSEKELIRKNLENQLTGIRPFDSVFNGVGSAMDFDAAVTLQANGDYIEFDYILENLGVTTPGAESMGMFGERGTGNTNIGIFTNGFLYVRDSVGTWMTLDGFNAQEKITGLTVRLKLSFEAGVVKSYRNGIFQKSFTASNLVIENIGAAYNISPDSTFKGKIRNVKISHTAGTLIEFSTPFLYADAVNSGVEISPSESGYVPELQSMESKCFYELDVDGFGGSDKFMIYVSYGWNESYYVGFELVKMNDPAAYSLQYRINKAYLYKYDLGIMIAQGIELLVDGESECTYKVDGATDHTGGVHGDEQLVEADFYADGVKLPSIALSLPLTPCKEFYYKQISTMHQTDDLLHTIESIHHKITKFADGGYETFNRLIWQKTVAVTYWYHGICSLGKASSTEIHNEFLEHDVFTGDLSDKLEKVGAREYYAFDDVNKFSAFITSELIKLAAGDPLCDMFVWDRVADSKYYRQFFPLVSPVLDEIWESRQKVIFGKVK
jgi:hypothetical protein